MRAVSTYAVLIALSILTVAQTAPAPSSQGPGPSTGRGVVTNQSEASWKHSVNEKAGVESVALHEDPLTGALEVFGRYPAGYVFPPHWHQANERLVLIEGRMEIEQGGKQKVLEAGGFAFLPSREIQKMSCVSKTRCVLYMYWDAAFDIHRAP
jgi:hypothetical protein